MELAKLGDCRWFAAKGEGERTRCVISEAVVYRLSKGPVVGTLYSLPAGIMKLPCTDGAVIL
jgi:hypothetical protein